MNDLPQMLDAGIKRLRQWKSEVVGCLILALTWSAMIFLVLHVKLVHVVWEGNSRIELLTSWGLNLAIMVVLPGIRMVYILMTLRRRNVMIARYSKLRESAS